MTARAVTPPPATRGHLAFDLVGIGLLALLVRVPAFLAPKGLTFDDGVFSLSALAMRDGGVPFAEVFSSQGPLFLPLVWAGDLLGLRTINSPRVLAVASGIAAAMLTYLVARRLRDRTAGLLAGALVATSGALTWVTGPLAADGPALAFAVATVLFALWFRDAPSTRNAVLVGLGTGAVLSTKSLEAPVLVVVGLVMAAPLLSGLRRREIDRGALARILVAVGSSVVVFLAVSLPFGMAEVWDQSVRYRTDAADQRDIAATAVKLLSTVWDRDLALVFFAAVCVLWALYARLAGSSTGVDPNGVDPNGVDSNGGDPNGGSTVTGATRSEVDRESSESTRDTRWWSRSAWSADGTDWVPSDALLVSSWLACTVVWLVVVVSPLWRPHVAAVTIPLALVIAYWRPPARVCAVAAVVAVPLVVIQLDGLLSPGRYSGLNGELVAQLEQLPDGAWVISDEPGVVWRAGRRTTDDLVDSSMLRRAQGRYSAQSLLDAAQDPRVCAFVATSDERFGAFDELPAALEDLGYEPLTVTGVDSVLFVRSDCSPGSGSGS
ncbi:MAG: ArnT family glycosyltransferase [Microthrixaceae bacterium]